MCSCLIISRDWVDLVGTLKACHEPGTEPMATVIHTSLDSSLHKGRSEDHFGLPPADISVCVDPDRTINAVLAMTEEKQRASLWPSAEPTGEVNKFSNGLSNGGSIFMNDLAKVTYAAVLPEAICLVRVPLGWTGSDLKMRHPLGFRGMDGGAGLISRPGQVVGTALPLKTEASHLMSAAVLGDGYFLMGATLLWTVAR